MSEMKRYQRKLIPVNIAVMIISLVAVISIMFLPLITADFSNSGEALAEIMNQSSGGQQESDGESGSGSGGQQEMSEVLSEGLKNLKFSVTAMDFANMAFADDPFKSIAELSAQTLKPITGDIFNVLLTQMVVSSQPDLQVENIDYNALYDKAQQLSSAEDPDEIINSIAGQLADEGNVAAADKDSFISNISSGIKSLYNDTVEYTGSFSTEGMICMYISNMSAGEGHDSSPMQGKTYSELIYSMLTSSDAVNSMISMYKMVGISLFMLEAFPALMWLILFLFAFFHLFAKNKRFTMWYVKLFGLHPCLTFGIAPLIIQAVFTSMLGAYAGLLGAIYSLTWISGGCYVALWLISIFWAFPIKRRIRKLKKSGESDNG